MDFQLELTRPLLLGGLIVIPLLVYFFYRSLVDLPRRQKLVSLVVRACIVALLVLSLAGLTLLEPTREMFVVFALDGSLSIGSESQRETTEFLERALSKQGRHQSARLHFAAEPGLVQLEPGKEPPELDVKGTNIAAGLEVAAAGIPPFYVPRIVLLSDGNETHGEALKAALNSGVPIWTVPLPTRDDPEVQVSAVHVPAQVAQGEPFYVEVVIDTNHDDEGTIEVYRGPHKLIEETKQLKKGENRFRFRQTVDHERLAEFAVRTRGFKDTLLDNNSDSGLVFTAGKPRVLMIEKDVSLARNLVWALEEQDIQVDVRPPQGMPDSLADLQNYELLMISNVPATDFSARQMDVARTYVQDLGGGLIMIGGDESFGLGGYYKSVIEEVLPVRSDFEKEKEKPSLAMVLVIDKSGSMGGQKIELAKEAARSAAELLGPRDQIGVIAFEGSTYWVCDIQPASNKSFVMDRISTIEAGGGTNMAPAMEEAYEALQSATAKLKHVIILTDGISSPGDFHGLASSMASAQMTVSTVGVGEGLDNNLLEEIARIGRGRYYFTNDPLSIPQIFAKETMTASKSAINELPFVPQTVRPTQVLANIDFETAPFLLGYVVTRPKATSEMILASEAGDPLLAWWRYGLGVSVAFTSDAKSRWAAEWVNWPGFGPFWAQVIRHAMRKSEAKGVVVETERKGARTLVRLDSVDAAGKYLNQAETELRVIGPGLSNESLPLRQTAPGRYETEFATSDAGAYHLELAQKQDGQVLYRQSRGVMVGYPDELRLRPTNEELLKQIAGTSGGRYKPDPESVFNPGDQTARRATPLWPWLVTIAALLFLFDVALRRIDFSLVFDGLRRSHRA